MGDKLTIEYEALRAAARSMLTIEDAFRRDGENGTLRAAVGHDALAQRLDDFSNAWRLRRGRIADEIGELQEVLATTIETFRHADSELAAPLRKQL